MSTELAEHQSPPPPPVSLPSISSRRILLISACVLLVLSLYAWFVSIGTWTHWPTLTDYYDQLATAFGHGSLILEARPDPALLALPDPYVLAARTGVPYPMDMSLYNGRFYLYFGPVPALLLLIPKLVIPGVIGDQYLVFAFICGIFLVEALFIINLSRRLFPFGSPFLLPLSLLAAGLIGPFTWILGMPSILNASINGGQFFFLAGLFLAFDLLDGAPPSIGRLMSIGALWAAAVGSRITQVLPVAFMTGLLIFRWTRQDPVAAKTAGLLRRVAALVLPLVVAAAALTWYNWARFGSIFETGTSYQLGAVPYRAYGMASYSPLFLVQNIYNYLLNPPLLRAAFPFFRPHNGITFSVVRWIPLPGIYWSQQITGLLYTAPFTLIALFPLLSALRRQPAGIQPDNRGPFRWLVAALVGSFTVGVALFLVFLWASERYIADFYPSLMLLAILGLWQADRAFPHRSLRRGLYVLSAAGLTIISLLISSLLALAINSDGFRLLNPVFWRQLSNLFRP